MTYEEISVFNQTIEEYKKLGSNPNFSSGAGVNRGAHIAVKTESGYKLGEALRGQIERHYVVTENLVSYHEMKIELKDPTVEYAHYVLTKGNYTEKAEFTKGVKSDLIIKDGAIFFSK